VISFGFPLLERVQSASFRHLPVAEAGVHTDLLLSSLFPCRRSAVDETSERLHRRRTSCGCDVLRANTWRNRDSCSRCRTLEWSSSGVDDTSDCHSPSTDSDDQRQRGGFESRENSYELWRIVRTNTDDIPCSTLIVQLQSSHLRYIRYSTISDVRPGMSLTAAARLPVLAQLVWRRRSPVNVPVLVVERETPDHMKDSSLYYSDAAAAAAGDMVDNSSPYRAIFSYWSWSVHMIDRLPVGAVHRSSRLLQTSTTDINIGELCVAGDDLPHTAHRWVTPCWHCAQLITRHHHHHFYRRYYRYLRATKQSNVQQTRSHFSRRQITR